MSNQEIEFAAELDSFGTIAFNTFIEKIKSEMYGGGRRNVLAFGVPIELHFTAEADLDCNHPWQGQYPDSFFRTPNYTRSSESKCLKRAGEVCIGDHTLFDFRAGVKLRRKEGMKGADAHKYMLAEVESWNEYCNNEWWYEVLSVEALVLDSDGEYVNEFEEPYAYSTYIGGVSNQCDQDEIIGYFSDLVYEALHDTVNALVPPMQRAIRERLHANGTRENPALAAAPILE